MNYGYDCIKLFSSKEYAEQFMRGDIRMTRISHYRTIECRISGVKDPYEGKRKINCPKNTRLFIGVELAEMDDGDGSNIFEWKECPITNLGQSFIGADNTFCLCATDIATSTVPEGDELKWTPEYLPFLDDYECGVLFVSSELVSKLRNYAETNSFEFIHGLVEYKSRTMSLEEAIVSNGQPVSAPDLIFAKDDFFGYQHEYRFALIPTLERIGSGEKIAPGQIAFNAPVDALHNAMCLPIGLINEMTFKESSRTKRARWQKP